MLALKRAIPAALLLGFAGAAVVAGALRSSAVPAEATLAARGDGAAVVYYFHGETRCFTCNNIEKRTAALVRSAFASELAEGRLRFEVVNFDHPDHRHFRKDFDLAFSTVVVQSAGEGQPFKNLDDVWKLVRAEDDGFETYLVREIRPMVGS